ncbi:ABC transporter [bacterium]|nr:MAG: ABC transporter [bacterium]
MNGVRGILYREFKLYSRRLPKHISGYLMSPFLFLLVFGWGVGRHVEMQGMTYIQFMLPGLATMSAMTQSYGMATEINIARFYWRIFEEFQMAPVSPWEIVLGEVIYGMARGLLAAGAVYFMGLFFGAWVAVGPLGILLYALHAFTFASAAVVAAMVVKTHADQGQINTFFIVPMSFLCGTFFPLERLPDWAGAVAKTLPLTHSNLAIRAVIFGQPLPVGSVLALLAFGIVFFALAVHLVRRAAV